MAAAVLAVAVALVPGAATEESQAGARARTPGRLRLVGRDPLLNRGMNAALAVHGGYAYVGSRTDGKAGNANHAGVLVVDVSNPRRPRVVHEIGPPHEGNEGETSRELRVWPQQDLLIVMNLGSNCSPVIHTCSPRSVDDNFRFYDISGKRAARPRLVATYRPSVNPHEFFLWVDPDRPRRALLFMSTPGGDTQLLITDISGARRGRFRELGTAVFPGMEDRLHSLTVSNDGRRAYLAHLQGGFAVIDTSEFARGVRNPRVRILTPPENAPSWPGPGAHSAIRLYGDDHVLVTDEVYGDALKPLGDHGCPWGWTRFIDASDPVRPRVVSDYRLVYNHRRYCRTDPPRPSSSYSAHNPTITKNLAFISWHAGGLQVVDISNPRRPRQAAQFVPEPLPYVLQEDPVLTAGQDKVAVWSFPIIKDGLIYVVDIRNGLYILDYDGPHQREFESVGFIEGNSNLGDALRFE